MSHFKIINPFLADKYEALCDNDSCVSYSDDYYSPLNRKKQTFSQIQCVFMKMGFLTDSQHSAPTQEVECSEGSRNQSCGGDGVGCTFIISTR